MQIEDRLVATAVAAAVPPKDVPKFMREQCAGMLLDFEMVQTKDMRRAACIVIGDLLKQLAEVAQKVTDLGGEHGLPT
jgi:hypothetical protein